MPLAPARLTRRAMLSPLRRSRVSFAARLFVICPVVRRAGKPLVQDRRVRLVAGQTR